MLTEDGVGISGISVCVPSGVGEASCAAAGCGRPVKKNRNAKTTHKRPAWNSRFCILEPELGPVCARQHGAQQANEDNEQDQTAAAASARETAPKTEPVLEPVEERIQQNKLEQT